MKSSALGSYPRVGDGPERQRLRRAIQAFQAGRIPAEELERVQDEVTREVIAEQEASGLDWVTDGLVRWEDGQTYFTDRLEGFRRGGLLRYFDTNTYYRQPVVIGAVSWKEPITVEDYRFAARHATRPVRPVVTGPFTLARLSLDEHYRDPQRLVADLARALGSELQALAAEGAPAVQVDEPALTRHEVDPAWVRSTFASLLEGVSAPAWIALYLGSARRLLDEIHSWPFAGAWIDCVSDRGVLDRLAERPFPDAKLLGLGLADGRNTKLESVPALVADMRRVAARTPHERLAVTTSAGLEFLPRDRARQKLDRLVEGVRAFAAG
jgi:5-methyltetrahydropteroyltriglutamate--homocysteine methyltransferase